MRRPLLAVYLAGLLALASVGAAKAQEEEIGARELISLVDGDARLYLILGGVHFAIGNTDIWADNVVIWCDRSETDPGAFLAAESDFRFGYAFPERGPAAEARGGAFLTLLEKTSGDDSSGASLDSLADYVTEICADGNVRMVTRPLGNRPLGGGAPGSDAAGGSIVEASRLYFHLEENRGVIMDGEVRSSVMIRDKLNPLVLRAKEIRQVCADCSVARDAEITTCTYSDPHYCVRADRITLKGGPLDGELTIADGSVDLAGAQVPLPDMSFALGEDWPIPLRRLRTGRSSKYGVYVEALLGKDMNATGKAVHESLGIDAPFKGSWSLDLDIYGKRGIGIGPGIEYKSPKLYKGFIKTWYINDKSGHDRHNEPVENNDRGWIQTRNRVQLPDFWLLDLELSYISEKRLLEEYFEEEVREDKDQETLAYIHRGHESQFWSLLAKTRINDFQTETDQIPEGRWAVTQIPLLRRGDIGLDEGGISFHDVYYRHAVSAVQLRYRQSDQERTAPALPTDRLTRADYLGGLEAPINVGPVKFTPYAEQRVSFFEETLNDRNREYRYVAGAGAKASIMLSRVSEGRNKFLNIDGLRHVFEPTVDYRNNYHANPESDELYQYDEIDAVTDQQVVLLGLRHRMQTRDADDGSPKTFFEGFYALPTYPDEDDNPTGERYGNFRFDMLWTPDMDPEVLKNLVVNEEGEWNLYTDDLDELNSFASLKPYPEFGVHASHRWIRNIHSFVTVGFVYVLTPRWELDLEFRRDLEENRWMRESIILRRRAHQWVFEFEASVDRSDDNRSIAVSVVPLALFGSDEGGTFYDPYHGN